MTSSDSGFTHHNRQSQLLTAGNSAQAMPILGIGILFAETYKMEILAQLKMNFLAAMSIVGGVR